jgi:hypothetical protein
MCSDKPKTAERTEGKAVEKESFKSVYDTLDQMEIPITLTWDKWNDLYRKHADKYGLGLGENITDHPFAKLAEGKDFKAFVFVSRDETGSPVIITFDKNGKEIDSFGLLGDIASNDPGNWTKELAIINRDLTIQFIDSVWAYDLDHDGGRIESSGKLTTKNQLYRLLDSGKFEKIR